MRALLADADGATAARDGRRRRTGSVPSIVDLAPAAGWDEREAHDLYGVGFDGHEPLRPLVDHDLELDRWTVPVRGHDAYQVAVGPIHAGVIESGHFRFHVVGDRILHLDARLFYKHRGLERAAEGHDARRTGSAYAHARLRGLRRRERRRLRARLRGGARARADARARARAHDPARARAHLEPPQRHRRGLRRRRARRGQQPLRRRSPSARAGSTRRSPAIASSSARSQVGGSELDARRATACAPRATSSPRCASEARRGWRELLFNRSFQDRLPGIGVVDAGRRATRSARSARPRARPALADDVRATQPAARLRRLRARRCPSAPRATCRRGSSSARSSCEQSFELLERPARPADRGRAAPSPDAPERRSASAGSRARAARRSASSSARDDRIERLRLRTGSYANWPVVAHAAAGNLLPDFPLINKSFELCYACADR